MSRFRLIPTQRAKGSVFVYGSPLEALSAAQEMSTDRECPVMVVEHPIDGLIRAVATIGEDPKKKVRRAA